MLNRGQSIINYYAVSVVVILGSERLYSDMARRFKEQNTGAGEKITVIKLDKSGGCVDRDEEYLRQYRQAQVREYFFGDSRSTLSPHTQQIDFNQLSIYKIAECKSTYSQPRPRSPLIEAPQPPTFSTHSSLVAKVTMFQT